jgi:hypothetical protein
VSATVDRTDWLFGDGKAESDYQQFDGRIGDGLWPEEMILLNVPPIDEMASAASVEEGALTEELLQQRVVEEQTEVATVDDECSVTGKHIDVADLSDAAIERRHYQRKSGARRNSQNIWR